MHALSLLARNEARVEQMPHLTEVVLETTLLNRLDADIQVEVLCFEPQGWVQMVNAAWGGLEDIIRGTSLQTSPLRTN